MNVLMSAEFTGDKEGDLARADRFKTKKVDLPIVTNKLEYFDLWESKDTNYLIHSKIPVGCPCYVLEWVSEMSPAKTFNLAQSILRSYKQANTSPETNSEYIPFITYYTPGDEVMETKRIVYPGRLSWKSVAEFNPISVMLDTETGVFTLDALTKHRCLIKFSSHQSDIIPLVHLVNITTKDGIPLDEAEYFIRKIRNIFIIQDALNKTIKSKNKKLQ